MDDEFDVRRSPVKDPPGAATLNDIIDEALSDAHKNEDLNEFAKSKIACYRNLGPKKRDFCNYYFKSGVGAQSAIKAGYAEGSAAQTAHNLLKDKSVQEYILSLYEHEKNQIIISASIMKEKLLAMVFDETVKDEYQLKAGDMFNKMSGFYSPEKVEVEQEIKYFPILPDDDPYNTPVIDDEEED